MGYTITPLTPHTGAEVRGIDLNEEVDAETRAALARGAVGTPTLALTGSDVCLLGPVLGAVPQGDEALELWETVWFTLRHPYVYELKRNRDQGTPQGI